MSDKFSYDPENNQVTIANDYEGDSEQLQMQLSGIPPELRDKVTIIDNREGNPLSTKTQEPENQEVKVTDTPPEKTPEQEAAEKLAQGSGQPPAINLDYGKFGEDVKSVDDIYSKWDTTTKTLTEKEAELQAALEERDKYKNNNSFKDKDEYAETMLRRENPEDYKILMRIKYGGVQNDAEILALDFMRENPGSFEDVDKAIKYVNRKYKETPLKNEIKPEGGEDEDELREINQKNLKIQEENKEIEEQNEFLRTERGIEANKARAKFTEMTNKYEMPEPPDPEKLKEEQNELARSWEPVFNDDILKVSSIQLEDGIKYDLNDEEKKYYAGMIARYVIDNKLKPDAASTKEAKDYVANSLWATPNIRSSMLKKVTQTVKSMSEEEFEKYEKGKYFNPSAITENHTPPPVQEKSKQEEEYEKLDKALGL